MNILIFFEILRNKLDKYTYIDNTKYTHVHTHTRTIFKGNANLNKNYDKYNNITNLYFPNDKKYTKNYAFPHKYKVSNSLFLDEPKFEFQAIWYT